MRSNSTNPVAKAIATHPWSSLQDALLVLAAVLCAVILALEYELLRFGEELTAEARRITTEELFLITAVLGIGIVGFVLRRLHEARKDMLIRLERDAEMQKLRIQALEDPLTGLLNRRGMLSALEQATEGPHQEGRRHAFFLLDLNDFKRVNDAYGHAVGDQVLNVVVERFRAAARPQDVLARLGGDEFAVLALDVDRRSAHAIGQRYIVALRNQISVEGVAHKIGVSVGAALVPEDGITAREILNNADAAMYAAKEQGGSALAFFDGAEPGPESRQRA